MTELLDHAKKKLTYSSIFQICAATFLCPRGIPNGVYAFFLLVSNINYIIILLWGQLSLITTFNTKEMFSYAIYRISQTLTVYNLGNLNTGPSEVPILTIVIWAYVILILTIILGMIVRFRIKQNITQFGSFFLFLLCQFHLSIGFWIASVILFDSLSSYDDQSQFIEGINVNFLVIKIAHFIIIILNCVMTLFISIFSYSPCRGYNKYSVHTPAFQVLTFVFKASIAPLIAIQDKTDSTMGLFIAFSILISVVRHAYLLRIFPYYHYAAMKKATTLSSIALVFSWCNIVALVLKVTMNTSGIVIVYIEALLLPFVIKQSGNILQRIIQTSYAKDIDKINSEGEIMKKFFSMYHVMQNPKINLESYKSINLSEIQLWGQISHYPEKEEILQNSMTISENLYAGSQAVESVYTMFKNTMICSTLRTLVKRNLTNKKLKFILANHISEQNINFVAAVTYLTEISKQKGLLQAPCNRLLVEIEQKIHNGFQSKEDGMLDIKSFIDFDTIAGEFTKMLYANTNRFINFWELYKKAKFEIIDLFKRSQVIEAEDTKIKQLWSRQIEKQKLFANSLKHLYSNYLLLVRNAPNSAYKLKEKFKGFDSYADRDKEDEPITARNIVSPDNIILTVSMEKGQVGKVYYVSSNITMSLGWTQFDLVGRSMSTILPHFMREKHMQIMVRYLEATYRVSQLSRHLESFILTKDNHIIPCRVYLSVHPYIQDELKYTAIIKLKRSDPNLMLLDEHGNLEGFTNEIGNQLNLALGRQYTIADLCTEIQEIDAEGKIHPLSNQKQLYNQKSNIFSLNQNQESSTNNSQGVNKAKFSMNNWKAVQASNKTEFYLKLRSTGKMNVKQSYNEGSNAYIASLKVNNIEDLKFQVLTLKPYISESERSVSSLDQGANKIVVKEVQLESIMDDISYIPSERIIPFLKSNKPEAKRRPSCLMPDAEKNNLMSQISTLINSENKLHPLKTLNSNKKSIEKSSPGGILLALEKRKISRRRPGDGMGDHDGSSYYSSVTNSNAKLEDAIYIIPQQVGLRNLSFLMIFLVLSASLFLIIFGSQNIHTVDIVGNLIEVISASTMQLLVLVECNRLMIWYGLLESQIGTYDRYTWAGIPDTRFILGVRLEVQLEEIAKYNALIRKSLYVLDPSSHEKVYRKMPAVEWSPITNQTTFRQTDSLDLVSSIITSGKKVINSHYADLSSRDQDVAFIVNNTMNDLLVAGEDLVQVFLDDTKQKLSGLSSLLILFLSLVGGLSLVFIGFLLNLQKNLMNDRDRLFDILLRLSDQDLDKRLKVVTRFRAALDKNNLNGRHFEFETEEDDYLPEAKAKTAQSPHLYKKRLASRKNINASLIRITIGSIGIVVLLLVGFVVVLATLESQNTAINSKIDMLVSSNFSLYQLGALFISLYEYVAKNTDTTLRGRPIQEEWDQTFIKLSDLQEKLILVTDTEKGLGGDAQLVELIKGNLCQVLVSDPYAGAQCAGLIYGIVQKGIIQVNTFMISLIQRIKQNFDKSDRTHSDMFEAINQVDLVQVEPVWALYMVPGYQLIDKLIRERLDSDVKMYGNAITVTASVCGSLFIVFGIFLWWKIKGAFEKERVDWKKMVRLVPDTVILNNKMLKSYLVANSNNTFRFK